MKRAIFLVMLGLTGCLATTSTAPIAVAVTQFDHQMPNFDDPLMTGLLAQLLAKNLDLKIAEQRVAEAQAAIKARQSSLWPQLDASVSANRGNQNNRGNATLLQAGLDSRWDIDLAGGLQDAVTAAKARSDASADRLRDLRRLLAADLQRSVIEWRAAQQIQRETTALLRAQDDQVTLLASRADAGLIDSTLVERARAQRDQTATQLPLAEINRRTAQFQIERLLGQQPHNLENLLAAHADHDLTVPAANLVLEIPLTTITARPDVTAARAELLAAQADLAEAEAAWWPSLSLSSFFGVSDGSHNMTLPGNPIWSLGSALTTPLLNFGRIDAEIDAANARSQQANLRYQNTILTAMQETHTALAGYLNGLNAITRQTEARNRRAETVNLATQRFDRGLTDMTVLTTAQSELDQATISLINQKAAAAIAYINLITAVGTISGPTS